MTTPSSQSKTSFHAQLVASDAALRELRGDWESLNPTVPFCTWQWLESWWRHYRRPHMQLFTVAVRTADGELVGLAPWYLEHSRGQGRVVRFLGDGEVCSDYLSILARPNREQQVSQCVADWLAVEGSDQWDLVELAGFEAESFAMEQFADRLRGKRHLVHEQADVNCWRLTLPATWEDYLRSLSKSRRQRTRMICRRTFETGRAQMHLVKTLDELDRGFEILVDLHQKRRASLSEPGCFASQRFTNFHREVSARMLECGRLRMVWLELDGRPIAAEYGFTGGSTIYYYQGGFEPDAADERPGWLSFAASLQLAMRDGYRWFDFLRGDESYKSSWGAEVEPLGKMRIVARRRSARLRHAAWQTGETVKRWARRGLSIAEVWKPDSLRIGANGSRGHASEPHNAKAESSD